MGRNTGTGGGMAIAIIGAGMAGAVLARRLAGAGLPVTVFDKGRGPGGRMATRRLSAGGRDLRFDHGAQYFTAIDPSFRRAVTAWRDAGITAPWSPRLVRMDGSGIRPEAPAVRHVGTPSMSAVIRHVTDGLDIRWGVEAGRPARDGEGWSLRSAGGADLGRFDRVLLAIPPEQAKTRLPDGVLEGILDSVVMAPCFAAMVPAAGTHDPGFDAAFVADGGPAAWIARQGSRPGREATGWIVHAAPDWSRDHLEDDRADVAAALTAHLARLIGRPGLSASDTVVHRWRHARTETPLGVPCHFDPDAGIGLAGDWCLGARVEAAFLSGRALASAVAGSGAG